MRRLVYVSVLFPAIFALGCDQETIDETGDLEQPSGLVVVHRPNAAQPGTREDLLIVDAAAEGVRVQQFYRYEDPEIEDAVTQFNFDFVRSPSVFFPLVIPAEGSPSEVAVNIEGSRAYVIAPFAPARDPQTHKKQAELPASAQLYVLDVTMSQEIPGRATEPGNTTLGAIALQDHPVDVVVLSSSTSSSQTDRVAVLSDRFDGTGRLLVLDVTTTDAGPTAAVVADLALGASPRSMIVLSGPEIVLIGLAGAADANQVAQVDLQTTPPSVNLVEVGGPISRVIGIDEQRALALRADVPAVIVLQRQSDGLFARSTEEFSTPYTKPASLGPGVVAGRIDTPNFVVSGAFAKPTAGFEDMDIETVVADGVVMLTLLDGNAVFLKGGSLQMQVDGPAVVRQIQPTAKVSPLRILECETEVIQWCVDLDSSTDDADPTVCTGLVRPSGLNNDGQFRAVYRGALVSERGVTLVARTATSAANVKISLGFSIDQRLVQAGDVVDLQGAGCATYPDSWWLSGTVVTVSSELEVRFDLEGRPSVEDLNGCDLSSALLEVRPSGEEYVLQRLQNHVVAEVEARVPVVVGPNGREARIEVRPDGSPTSLAFTVVNTTTIAPGAWSSIDERRCEFASQCGSGRSCARATLIGTTSCPSLCTAVCDGSAGCNPEELTWTGSGLEFDVLASDVKVVDLGDTALRQILNVNDFEVINAIPHETVWMPVWQAWATSFPGSRTVVRLRPSTDGFSLSLSR